MGFETAIPINRLWVATTGSDTTGDGSAANPFLTIQAAVNRVTPGTAIMVKEGTYVENAVFNQVKGTEDAPIWLISADGVGKAVVRAADNIESTIKGLGTEYVVVEGFKVEGGKNGIAFTQRGVDFSQIVDHLIIRDNVISGSIEDAIKIAQAENVQILRNTVLNAGSGGQGIDFVAVNNATIAYNDISQAGTPAAIFVKGGSQNVLIQGNYIHDSLGDGINAGGYSGARFIWPGQIVEATNIVITGNRVENVGLRAVGVIGAHNVLISDNYLMALIRPIVSVTRSAPGTEYSTDPAFVEVTNNVFGKSTNLLSTDFPQAVNFHDNATSGAWSLGVGVGAGAGSENLVPPAPLPMSMPPDYSNVQRTQLFGTEGADVLTAGQEPTRIDGLGGADILIGGAGPDALLGGDGNDILIAGMGPVSMDGGAEVDKAFFDRVTDSRSFIINLRDSHNQQMLIDGSTIVNVEQINFVGGSGDDVVFGGDLTDVIDGRGGHNFIFGGGGDDIIYAHTGDVAYGGDGNDSFFVTGNPFYVAGDSKINTVVFYGHVVLGRANMRNIAIYTALDGATVDLTNYHMGVTITPYAPAPLGLTVTGSTFADTLVGGEGSDVLNGYDGNDIIEGRGGTNTLIGAAGDDEIRSLTGSGRDSIDGGEGVDWLVLQRSNLDIGLSVDLMLSAVQILADGTRIQNIERISFEGGGGKDFVRGGARDDVLNGGAGNDTLIGGAGNDALIGGTDSDTMTGCLGDDDYTISEIGDLAIENLDEGYDTVRTSLSSYTLGANIERLVYAGASDFFGNGNVLDNNISGASGADILRGRDGSDTLIGGDGDDKLYGEKGFDTILGGNGNDFIRSLTGDGADIIDGGDGLDLLTLERLDATIALRLDLTQAGWQSVGEGTRFTNIEQLRIAAGSGIDYLRGGNLDDVLKGGDGGDTLIGGAGNDILVGGAGADSMTGGLGDDDYTVTDLGDSVTENVDEGFDTLKTTLGSYALGANLERLVYTGALSFAGTGNARDNAITGGAGADILRGGQGNDILAGGDGDDKLYGEAGFDTIFGGGGNDFIRSLTGEGADVIDGGDGVDLLTLERLDATANLSVDLALFGMQAVGDGTSFINIEQIRFAGGLGNDYLRGGDLDDVLKGGAGRDILVGGAGADVLQGGDGSDTLTGGAGSDNFRLDAPSPNGFDSIIDFSSGDLLLLSRSGFGIADFSSVEFISGTSSMSASFGPTLLFNSSSGQLHWDANGGDASDSVLIALLVNGGSLSRSSFGIF